MAFELDDQVCAMCEVRLTDASSVVENEGTLYCCGNCFAHATQPVAAQSAPAGEVCAYCGLVLVDRTSRVERGVKVYCCNNCANAPERALFGRPA